MRSLAYGMAVTILTAACASAGVAQSRPPVSPPASQPISLTPPAGLVGTWDAITRSHGGIGSTVLLSPDSAFTLVLGAMVEMKYRIEGNKFTFFSDQLGNQSSETQTLTFVGGSPVFSGNGCSRKLKRLDTETPSSGLIGKWQSMHMTGVPAYEEYTAEGLTRLRVPIQVQKGSFSITGNTVVFHTLSPRLEDWSAQFSLQGDTLTFSIGSERHRYLHARQLIPFDVQQPAKSAGLVC